MIELSGIHKTFGQGEAAVHALESVDLAIGNGDFLTVMGPSGSGKSTLLSILGLLDTSSGGSYRLEGRNVVNLSEKEKARVRCRHFGFVFQSFQLFHELDAMANVMMPMSFLGEPRRKAQDRACELLEAVELGHRLHHCPSMMSGGEQQRVAIARALANDPDYLFADEPTGNLPHVMGQDILKILKNLNAQGVTLVLVTHDDGIGAQGGRQLRIEDGRLRELTP